MLSHTLICSDILYQCLTQITSCSDVHTCMDVYLYCNIVYRRLWIYIDYRSPRHQIHNDNHSFYYSSAKICQPCDYWILAIFGLRWWNNTIILSSSMDLISIIPIRFDWMDYETCQTCRLLCHNPMSIYHELMTIYNIIILYEVEIRTFVNSPTDCV